MYKLNLRQYLKSADAKIYYWCLSITLAWRLFLEILNQAQAHLYHQPVAINTNALGYLARWAHWDGGWYLGIVEQGYKIQPGAHYQSSIVFFPAFPSVTRLIADTTGLNPILAGLILNTVVTSIACFFMYKLTITIAQKYGKKLYISQRYLGVLGVLCLLLYPASLFFAAYYVEPLLVLGIIASIYFTLKNRLWWAAFFMVIATASKSSGLVLLPVDALIVFEQWNAGKKRSYQVLTKKIGILAAGVIGLGAFMLYQFVKFGNAFLFYKDQSAWRPSNGFFLNEVYQRYYSHFFQESYYGHAYYYALNLFVMLLPLVIVFIGVWIIVKYKTYWPLLLGFLSMAVPISTGTLLSLNRIAIVAIPMTTFIILACAKKREHRVALICLLVISGLFLVLFSIGFLRGKFAG